MVSAYEVKVSRGDYLRDDKWRGYLAFCNEFYFVCPDGLIKPEEVPEGAGLYWVAKTGTQLRRKKRAPTREVRIPESVFRYILFSRARIDPPRPHERLFEKKGRAYWENWLQVKKLDWEFGRAVGRRIQQVIEERINQVEQKSREVARENERLREVEEFLKSIGMTSKTSWFSLNGVRSRLEELNQVFSPEIMRALDQTAKGIASLTENVKRRQWTLKDGEGEKTHARRA